MTTLNDKIQAMLKDVSKAKATRKRAKTAKDGILSKTIMGKLDVGPAPIKNPWTDEFISMVQTITTCKCCGNSATSWEPHVFMERHRVYNGKPERLLEIIECSNIEELYRHYPKRVETIEYQTEHCPLCLFDLPDDLPQGMFQRELPYATHYQLTMGEKENVN